MTAKFEYLEMCGTNTLETQLAEEYPAFASTLKFELSAALEELLHKNNLLLQVKHLISVGVNSKTSLYALCTKDILKFPNINSTVFYLWNKEKHLWEEHHKSQLEKTALKQIIQNIYMSVYMLVQNLEDYTLLPHKNSKIISTKADLCHQLLVMKDKFILKAKVNEVLHDYITAVVDENFLRLINPPGYVAVGNKQVVNLRTGEVKAREKTDYFTQEITTKYNPKAYSEIWENTINQIMLYHDIERDFLQEFLGYALSGDCREGKIFMAIGESKAGKSILINFLISLLTNFSINLNKSLIINSGRGAEAPDPFIAELANKRVGIINELEQSDVINTTKFKTLATNEGYCYRLLNSNKIEKTNSRHVLLLASNHKPTFPETDQSIWERLVIMNFRAKFTDNPKEENEYKIDPKLREKLESEHEKEAFLKWLIDGSIRYFNRGKLVIPQSCLDSLEEYKSVSQDENESYFFDRIEITKNKKDRIQSSELFNDYIEWAISKHVKKQMTRVGFSEFMHRKKVPKTKISNTYYTHIKLKDTMDI